MKNTVLILALATAFPATVLAQSTVQVYGALDAGLVKRTNLSTAVGKRDANTLGFRGTEDLGNGIKALLHLEIRYEPDTGTQESVVRPLFQGQSRVGLQGSFGMVRIGRGTSPYMESIIGFEPFHGIPSAGGFYTDLTVAGFTSQPLDAAGNSFNRISNAIFYNSPARGGLQFNAAVSSREAGNNAAIVGRGTVAAPQYGPNAQASANPFSISGTYKGGTVAAMLGYERNGIESNVWSIGASINPLPSLKLMASYSDQDRSHTMAINSSTTAWVVGANYAALGGSLLLGYGTKEPDGLVETKQLSIGYEYPLSKRTFLYVDASQRKAATTLRYYDLGIRTTF